MKLRELMLRRCDELINTYPKADIPAGVNGPWNDAMLPTRNLGHAICLVSYSFILTKDSRYLDYLNLLISKLLTFKDENGFYVSRIGHHKNIYNGLVGQAWVAEALISAYKATSEACLLLEAEDLFCRHRFDLDNSGWVQAGDESEYFRALNQQVYFSAILSDFISHRKNAGLQENLNKNINQIMIWLEDGFFRMPWHVIGHGVSSKYKIHNLKLTLGYCSFILFGLGILLKNEKSYKQGLVHKCFHKLDSGLLFYLIKSSPFSVYYNQTVLEFLVYRKYIDINGGPDLGEYMASQTAANEVSCDLITHRLRLYEGMYLDDSF